MDNSSELVAPKRSDNMDIKSEREVGGTNITRLDHRHFNVNKLELRYHGSFN